MNVATNGNVAARDTYSLHRKRILPAARLGQSQGPPLTVILPAYHEAATVSELLGRFNVVPYRKHVIAMDDGAADDTAQTLEACRGSPVFQLLRDGTNRGNGAAIRTALKHARGRLTIIQDADLEHDPEDYSKLLEPLLSGEANVVYGSRRLQRQISWHDLLNPFYHGVSLLNLCVSVWYRVGITDEATCYKVFPTEVLRGIELECQPFEFCAQVMPRPAGWDLRSRKCRSPTTHEDSGTVRRADFGTGFMQNSGYGGGATGVLPPGGIGRATMRTGL